jgi:hypothetical protein
MKTTLTLDKKGLIAATLFIATTCLMTMTSCKKSTCECTAYNTNNPDPGGQSNYIVKGNQSKQKSLCTDKSTQPDSYGNYTTCVIK